MNLHKIFGNYYPMRQLLICCKNEMRFNGIQTQLTRNINTIEEKACLLLV